MGKVRPSLNSYIITVVTYPQILFSSCLSFPLQFSLHVISPEDMRGIDDHIILRQIAAFRQFPQLWKSLAIFFNFPRHFAKVAIFWGPIHEANIQQFSS